ncbi:hypothetical protein ACFFR6_23090 [Saccharothrix mutabilis subsp. capreolus]|uniref:hypothetical protein n=1 Tax=Saccharothrix mutabilis TaxID=33921 RepID=UPI0035EB10E8
MPSPEHAMYFAGLGLLAVFGVVEWPVALAIGTGTLVAERMSRKPPPQRESGEPIPE